MAFVVRGKSGKVVGRYATRGEAEARIEQLKDGANRLRSFQFSPGDDFKRGTGTKRAPGGRGRIRKAKWETYRGFTLDLEKRPHVQYSRAAFRVVIYRQGGGPGRMVGDAMADTEELAWAKARALVDSIRSNPYNPDNQSPHRSSRSPHRAAIIRGAYESFERAREVHDPKRFKRGGGYTPEENAAIARAAGLRKPPSNRARGKLELYEFKSNPPDKLFAYYENDAQVGSRVKTWTGDELGRVTHRGKEARKINGGRSVAIRIRGINGVTYAGTCNLTGGTYCNLRRVAT